MKTRLIITALALLVVGTTAVSAQHQHAGGIVRGIEHPERIPDAVAYRVWFDSISGMEESHREDAIRAVGMTKQDHDVLVIELGRYNTLRDALRTAYNKHQEQTGGKDVASILKYQADVAALVAQTRKNINANTAPFTGLRLQEHIQREKAHMTISESEAQ
jgi:hypothetical protein